MTVRLWPLAFALGALLLASCAPAPANVWRTVGTPAARTVPGPDAPASAPGVPQGPDLAATIRAAQGTAVAQQAGVYELGAYATGTSQSATAVAIGTAAAYERTRVAQWDALAQQQTAVALEGTRAAVALAMTRDAEYGTAMAVAIVRTRDADREAGAIAARRAAEQRARDDSVANAVYQAQIWLTRALAGAAILFILGAAGALAWGLYGLARVIHAEADRIAPALVDEETPPAAAPIPAAPDWKTVHAMGEPAHVYPQKDSKEAARVTRRLVEFLDKARRVAGDESDVLPTDANIPGVSASVWQDRKNWLAYYWLPHSGAPGEPTRMDTTRAGSLRELRVMVAAGQARLTPPGAIRDA